MKEGASVSVEEKSSKSHFKFLQTTTSDQLMVTKRTNDQAFKWSQGSKFSIEEEKSKVLQTKSSTKDGLYGLYSSISGQC